METLNIPVSARRVLRVLIQSAHPKDFEALGVVEDAQGAPLYFVSASAYTRASALFTLAQALRRRGQVPSARALETAYPYT